MNNGERHRIVAFGPFRMDLTERLLTRQGKPVSIAPKLFETLTVLVENAGHLVRKDELMDRLWKGTFVEESSLSQNIFPTPQDTHKRDPRLDVYRDDTETRL